MKILGIETTTTLGGVAIMDSTAGLVAESTLNVRACSHSEQLIRDIERLLARARITLDDLDGLAVSAGPGSFTGLRIGLGTLKGLAFATGLRVLSVPTLEAMAWRFPVPGPLICPVNDARRKEVYAGAFEYADGEMVRVIAEVPISAEDFAERISGLGRDAIFFGEGAGIYRETVSRILGARVVFAPPHLMIPSPAAVALVGMKMAERGEWCDPVSLSPIYLRKSEAELRLR